MPVSSLTLGKAKIDRLEFSPDEVEELKANLLRLTKATVIVRSPMRDENGKIKYVEVPDNGLQLAATVKALEFAVGKPRQMMEVTTTGGSGNLPQPQNLSKLLAGNPALVTSILTTLKTSLENAQAIPVQAVTAENVNRPPELQSGAPQR